MDLHDVPRCLGGQVKPEVAKQEFKAKMDLKEGKMTVTVSCFHTHSDGGGRTYGAVTESALGRSGLMCSS